MSRLDRLVTYNPVRTYMYGVLGPLVALLVGYDVVSAADAPRWLALGAAVLGVPATELARARVRPVASLDE